VTVLDSGGSRHELTQNVDKIGDVKTGVSEVDKAPNQVTVALQIRQRIAIGGAEMHIELHMSLNSAFITKSGTSKKVVNVIVPGDRESIGGRGDLNPKEVANMTKISHEKLLTETGLDKGNVFRVVTSDDHVINIEKKKSPTTRRCVYKYHKIMCARKKSQLQTSQRQNAQNRREGLA
jgi:hypothetical protein